jgi:hypothetical protein
MRTCPNCKEVNENNSIYCNSCGQKLEKPKASRSFRNFIITISVLFSVILIGLIIFFLLNNSLLDIFKQQSTAITYGQNVQVNEDDSHETVYIISDDQKKVLSVFGYPEQFLILFDEGANNVRIDSWMYADMEVCFLFEDGTFIDSSEYAVFGTGEGNFLLKPNDFEYGMTPSEIEEVLGEQGEESLEEATGLKLLVFGNGEVICVFNDTDRLISISKNTLTGNI